MISQQLSFENGGIELIRFTVVNSRDMRGNHRFAIKQDPICIFRIIKLKKATS